MFYLLKNKYYPFFKPYFLQPFTLSLYLQLNPHYHIAFTWQFLHILPLFSLSFSKYSWILHYKLRKIYSKCLLPLVQISPYTQLLYKKDKKLSISFSLLLAFTKQPYSRACTAIYSFLHSRMLFLKKPLSLSLTAVFSWHHRGMLVSYAFYALISQDSDVHHTIPYYTILTIFSILLISISIMFPNNITGNHINHQLYKS